MDFYIAMTKKVGRAYNRNRYRCPWN